MIQDARYSRPRFLAAASIIGSLAIAGCGGAGASGAGRATSSPDEYVVERSVENGIETVRTVSGSRWGGRATLVEELSIGEEIGQDAYLFGSISAAWATEDRIYVVDAQVPAVRAFDLKGEYLFDIGNPGQGPGEYGIPSAVAVTSDGRVLVADAMNARISVYDAEGGFVEDWPLVSQKSALGLTLGTDGEIYTQAWSLDEGRLGIQAVGPEGLIGEILFPPQIEFEPATVPIGEGLDMILPFAPRYTWAFAPGGAVVAGTGEQYRVEVHRQDGTVTAIERRSEPVVVEAKEAEFRALLASRSLRLMSPDLSIGRGDIPPHKPAFSSFYPDRAGRVWVVRQGPGRPDPECIDADAAASPRLMMATAAGTSFEIGGKPGPWDAASLEGRCWADTYTFDVFDIASGDFLGTVGSPENGFRVPLFANTETVLAAVADELGTVRLKKYRLQIH